MTNDEAGDIPVRRIAEYVTSLSENDVSRQVRHRFIVHAIDAIGCALAGMDGSPSQIARRLAASGPSDAGVSVIGVDRPTVPEYAAFANTTMVRYLDFNDTFVGATSAHLSDLMPAVLASGESVHATGSQVIAGFHVAYEVFGALASAVALEQLGWDNGSFLKVAAAAGVARMLRQSTAQVAHSVSLAVTTGLPFHVSRTGELSHWKAASSGYAAMAGLFAARLASAGMTGPARPFSGAGGVWFRALPHFDLAAIGAGADGGSVVERSGIKRFPADYVAQPSIEAMIRLHRDGVSAADITSIDVRTYGLAWRFTGGGAGDHDEKWNPQTRETADHSLPFLMAVALADGDVTTGSFTSDRIHDPELRGFMRKVTVSEDANISSNWIDDPAHDLDVRLSDGARRNLRFSRTRGHHKNPMNDDEITAKFTANAERVLGSAQLRELLETLWRLEDLADIGDLMRLLRQVPTA